MSEQAVQHQNGQLYQVIYAGLGDLDGESLLWGAAILLAGEIWNINSLGQLQPGKASYLHYFPMAMPMVERDHTEVLA